MNELLYVILLKFGVPTARYTWFANVETDVVWSTSSFALAHVQAQRLTTSGSYKQVLIYRLTGTTIEFESEARKQPQPKD